MFFPTTCGQQTPRCACMPPRSLPVQQSGGKGSGPLQLGSLWDASLPAPELCFQEELVAHSPQFSLTGPEPHAHSQRSSFCLCLLLTTGLSLASALSTGHCAPLSSWPIPLTIVSLSQCPRGQHQADLLYPGRGPFLCSFSQEGSDG